MRDNYNIPRTFRITPFRKLRWWISDRMRHWKTLLKLLFETLTKWLRVKWVLILVFQFPSQRVLSRTIVLDRRRDQTLVGTRRVEDFSEIWVSVEGFRGTGMNEFFVWFNVHLVVQEGLDEHLLKIIVDGFQELFFHEIGLVDFRQVDLLVHPTIRNQL